MMIVSRGLHPKHPDCRINPFSGAVCAHGTKCCDVDHLTAIFGPAAPPTPLPMRGQPTALETPPKRIDEMTLADYRRGIANMRTRY